MSQDISDKEIVPRLLRAVTLLAASSLVLIFVIAMLGYFLATKRVEPVAITEGGRVVELVSLDKPYVNDARVAGFAEECLRASFAHDFENFRATMNTAKNCYTSEGARVFEEAMDPQLKDLTARRLVMTPSLEVTIVERKYVINGVVHWVTKTPMTIHRRGTRENANPEKFLVTSVIRRVPNDENLRGIATDSINLRPM